MYKQDIKPVFIMGAPRSGTTFLASSIASHQKIITLPEMQYIFSMMKKEYEFGEFNIQKNIDFFKNDYYFCLLNLFHSIDELKSFIEGKDLKNFIIKLINLYNEKYHHKDFTHWVEHSPYSHLFIQDIIKIFPNAKFIHIIRDPRAVCSSTIQQPWGYKEVVTGAKNWNSIIKDIISKEKEYNIFTIKYENFVSNQKMFLKEISKYIDIEYNNKMLENKGLIFPEHIENILNFYGAKTDQNKNKKWEKFLSKKEILHINAINYELMKMYGYDFMLDKKKEIRGFEKRIIEKIGTHKEAKAWKEFSKGMRDIFCHIN